MGESLAVRWVLSVASAATAVYHLYVLVCQDGRHRSLRPIIDDALHVLLGLAVIALVWPWGAAVPVILDVVVFTAAALWFAARALFAPSSSVVGFRDLAWYRGVLMAAVVWLAVVISVRMSTLPTEAAASATPTGTMPSMGIGPANNPVTLIAAPTELWVRIPCLVLAFGFTVATFSLLAGIRGRTSNSVVAGVVSALMSAATAFAFIELA